MKADTVGLLSADGSSRHFPPAKFIALPIFLYRKNCGRA